MKKRMKLHEGELKYTKEERDAFIESLKEFANFRNEIFRSGKLKEISQHIGQLVEVAEGVTLGETEGWFDSITVSRDVKRLRESYKIFEKTCDEITVLQQRLESAYEDIGNGLRRYY